MPPRRPIRASARAAAFGGAGLALVGGLTLVPHVAGPGSFRIREAAPDAVVRTARQASQEHVPHRRTGATGVPTPTDTSGPATAYPSATPTAGTTGSGSPTDPESTPPSDLRTDAPSDSPSDSPSEPAPSDPAESPTVAPSDSPSHSPGEPAPSDSTTPPASGSQFVTTCGTGFCLDGQSFAFRSASVYGVDDDRSEHIALAQQAGLTVIRLVNMLDENGPVSGATDENHWERIDADIAAAQQAGLHVELDLSSYRNLLANNGIDPYSQDWASFIKFVTNRVNTVTGVRYADDPTIALIAIAGEVQPPNYGANSPAPRPTASELYAFFARTEAELRADDPNHLRTTGGMLFLNDPYSGVNWRQLLTQSGDDVCAMHVYSQADLEQGMSNLASWCSGRPWIVEEYGMAQSSGDQARATFFDAITARVKQLGGAGEGFWNLGPGIGDENTDVNPQTPLAWTAVKQES